MTSDVIKMASYGEFVGNQLIVAIFVVIKRPTAWIRCLRVKDPRQSETKCTVQWADKAISNARSKSDLFHSEVWWSGKQIKQQQFSDCTKCVHVSLLLMDDKDDSKIAATLTGGGGVRSSSGPLWWTPGVRMPSQCRLWSTGGRSANGGWQWFGGEIWRWFYMFIYVFRIYSEYIFSSY